MTCPIDIDAICWIDGIYIYSEEEQNKQKVFPPQTNTITKEENFDVNTITSTSTESSSSYAEIVIPSSENGAQLRTPSTISSKTRSQCVKSGGSSTISEKTSPNISIYTSKETISPPFSMLGDISPIKRVKSFSSKSAQRYSSVAIIGEKDTIMNETTKSEDDGFINDMKENHCVTITQITNNLPFRYVHVPQGQHLNRHIVQKTPSPLSSTRDGRPPISPKSKEKWENNKKRGYAKSPVDYHSDTRCVADSTSLQAPPPLNRYLPIDDNFLFDGNKKNQCQGKEEDVYGESIEVRLGDAQNMNINQQVQVLEEKGKSSTSTGEELLNAPESHDLVTPQEEFPLQYDYEVQEEEEESLIGDDLVLDEDMCSDKVEGDFFPHMIVEDEAYEDETRDKFHWESAPRGI